jgi:predicted O-methyltransferase YrrM
MPHGSQVPEGKEIMELEIIHPEIESYLERLGEEGAEMRDPVRKEMEILAERLHFPAVGPLVGRLLYQFSRMIGAKRIFEMGSGFGYSAWWFAKGLQHQGEIICTDGSRENARRAADFFRRSGIEDRVRFEVGNALEVIDRYPGEFDIIFNDIDKEDYPTAFHKALPRLRHGGLLICDNVLWFGRVISKSTDPDVKGVQEFNRLTHATPGLITTILPVRDGVSVSLKL